MRRFTWLLGLMIVLLGPAAATAGDQILTFTGLGPVRIGMSVPEAEAALGVKLESYYPESKTEVCWYGSRSDGVDTRTSYMIQHGKIVRIDIYENEPGKLERAVPPISTERGIRIDSSAEQVKKAYGPGLDVRDHPQGDEIENYAFMAVLSDDRRHGLLFEIWEGRVKSFSAGTAEAFDLYETCI